jgi:hypothetical protein
LLFQLFCGSHNPTSRAQEEIMKSILSNEKVCFLCGANGPLEKHHCIGAAYRKKSEQQGLWVYLCKSCHNIPPNGVHHNRERMDALRATAEQAWIDEYDASIDDFIREFGRNYL